ncbi:hypothetical protein CsSME_00042075 [Camellia sinensis var. sinensis]
MEMPMMDTFFIPHAMLRNSVESTPSRPFLKSWKEEVMVRLPKPKSILIVSALGHLSSYSKPCPSQSDHV